MRTPVSHVLRWVRRADGTRRTPDRPGAPPAPPARRAPERTPDEPELSAPTILEPLGSPFRLESFHLETFGAPDVIPSMPRGAIASAADERERDSHADCLAMPVASGARPS